MEWVMKSKTSKIKNKPDEQTPTKNKNRIQSAFIVS